MRYLWEWALSLSNKEALNTGGVDDNIIDYSLEHVMRCEYHEKFTEETNDPSKRVL